MTPSSLYRLLPISFWTAFIVGACNNSDQSARETAKKVDTAAVKTMGKQVFTSNCQSCHGNPAYPKAPSAEAMAAMEPRVILNALNYGKMRQQAANLTEEQREAVAQYVTNKMLKAVVMPAEAY